ncbi:MAG: expansin-like protein [Pseudomonadota bacterium]
MMRPFSTGFLASFFFLVLGTSATGGIAQEEANYTKPPWRYATYRQDEGDGVTPLEDAKPAFFTRFGTGADGACRWDGMPFPNYGVFAVAAGPARWEGGLACGDVYELECKDGPNTQVSGGETCTEGKVQAVVVDSCPECAGDWLDLSTAVYDALTPNGSGTLDGELRRIKGDYDTNIEVDILAGSNAFFIQLLVRFSNLRINRVELRTPSGQWVDADFEQVATSWILKEVGTPYTLPLDIRFTTEDGGGALLPAVDNVINTYNGKVDSGVQF